MASTHQHPRAMASPTPASGQPNPKRWRWVAALIVALACLCFAALAPPALGIHRLEASDVGDSGRELEDAMDELLHDVVLRDGVDYQRLLARTDALHSIIALLDGVGPTSTPERFATQQEQLAYYINAYNALTLFGVVSHWPISSVHDVHGWLRVKDGFGFFWGTHYRLDGKTVNLYNLENDTIRAQFGDARIHAAINCASRSCPALRSGAYRAATLDEQLNSASEAFASEAPHVVVDDDADEIRLSPIFDWFAEDFVADAREAGEGDEALDWILMYARDDVAARLQRARAAEYAVVFATYDWSLNDAVPPNE